MGFLQSYLYSNYKVFVNNTVQLYFSIFQVVSHNHILINKGLIYFPLQYHILVSPFKLFTELNKLLHDIQFFFFFSFTCTSLQILLQAQMIYNDISWVCETNAHFIQSHKHSIVLFRRPPALFICVGLHFASIRFIFDIFHVKSPETPEKRQ